MGKVYYNRVQKLAPSLSLLALFFSLAVPLLAQTQSSLKTSALESHEGMTITACPWTDPAQYKEKFSKKSPLSAGMVAIQVAFRNDSDDSMKINLERIRLNVTLSEDSRQALNPLSADDAADVILNPGAKDPTQSRKKLPFPIPQSGPKVGRDKKWTELQKSLQDAAVKDSVIAPHSTSQGLLYFDLRSQFDLLNSAHLYVPEIVAIEKNHGLLYFEIDLSRASQ